MRLVNRAFAEGNCLFDLHARNMEEVFRAVLAQAVERGALEEDRREEIFAALVEHERTAPTAFGNASAVPHLYHDGMKDALIVFVRLARPLNLGAPDGVATQFIYVLLGPTRRAAEHLDTLATIARLMSDDEFRYECGQARNSQDLLAAMEHFVDRTTVPEKALPPPSPGLQYTGRLGGGLVRDARRRLPHYLSDFRDGLHTKALSSTLFLFFACVAPAVTFGGVMATYTDNHIGALEMLLASAICGVVYALFSGQPLIILGGTGPLLIFTAFLYQNCETRGIPFLPVYAWVGIWTMVFMIILAVTDASAMMRFFTRFTDETFAALISLIFIWEAIEKIAGEFHALDRGEGRHDTALLSLLLALGTYFVAINLSRFRRSRYLLPKMREFLADFGPAIAMLAMTLVAVWLHEVHLHGLKVPDRLEPTLGSGTEQGARPWFINPLEAPRWVWFASMIPAALAVVLVFLDQNITARLINSPDHNLHKGEAYHWDLAVVGGLIGFCSMFGLPWLVAATVRSLNHLRSLATTEEVVNRHGDTRERIIHVRENRVTGFSIHLLIGFSLLLLPYLSLIPLAVLYGLFLFMGVVSMAGNQFFQRLSLWFTDRNLYPPHHFVRTVPGRVIHAFTAIQLAGLVVLWLVKTHPQLGILFPLFIAILVPVRIIAGRFFSEEHLKALDSEEEPE
ncbi:MAG: PTS sugar transporter subunit IIA [Planctomycetes bacterium]|nr:PTS sugar transporter subunit IIA [Planctomycetota bacterium]